MKNPIKLTIPSDVVVGQYLQIAALAIAAAIAFVYTCGYQLGLFVHRLNDSLTEFHSLTFEGKKSVVFYYTRRIYNALQS